jgi:broad specificity phosphatase PhoE
MTATFLQRATGAPLGFDPLLQERNFGDLRGTAYTALEVDIFALDFVPPNGESWEVFHERVDRAWSLVRGMAAVAGGHLAVVTHGLVCRRLAERHLTLPAGVEVPARWENTGVTIAEEGAPWRVRVLNSIGHLEDLTARMPGGGAAV